MHDFKFHWLKQSTARHLIKELGMVASIKKMLLCMLIVSFGFMISRLISIFILGFHNSMIQMYL